MTPRSERRVKRPLAPNSAPLPLLALGAFFLTAASGSGPVRADAPSGSHPSSIRSVRTVRSGRIISYDITVTSTTEFPMRDELVTLDIGGQEFSNSHYLPGGDLNTLVFSLTQKQFQSLPTVAVGVIYYGKDDAALPKAQWAVGTLDKAMLDHALTASPVTDDSILAAPVAGSPISLGRVLAGRVKTGPAPSKPHAIAQRKDKK